MSVVADIRRVMLEKGISQAELGRTLGMSPSQLSSILRDEDYNFTLKMLRRFAAALGVDLLVRIGDSVPTEVPAKTMATGGVISGPVTINVHGRAEPPDDVIPINIKGLAGAQLSFTMREVDPDLEQMLLGYGRRRRLT